MVHQCSQSACALGAWCHSARIDDIAQDVDTFVDVLWTVGITMNLAIVRVRVAKLPSSEYVLMYCTHPLN